MVKKWMIPIFIGAGAVLLIFSSVIEPKSNGEHTLWFKIAGLILIMIGIYKASQVKPEQQTDDDNQLEEDFNTSQQEENSINSDND